MRQYIVYTLFTEQILFFSNAQILAMRRATTFGLHSIDWKLNEVSYSFFSPLGNAVPPSEANSIIFGQSMYYLFFNIQTVLLPLAQMACILTVMNKYFWNLVRALPFEYKYIWRDRNTSFSKICSRYDRARCSDNLIHKKVIIRGWAPVSDCIPAFAYRRSWLQT